MGKKIEGSFSRLWSATRISVKPSAILNILYMLPLGNIIRKHGISTVMLMTINYIFNRDQMKKLTSD